MGEESHRWVSVFVSCGYFIKDKEYIQEIVPSFSQSLGGGSLVQGHCLPWPGTQQCHSLDRNPRGHCRLGSDVTLYLEYSNLGICKMSSPFSLYTGDDSIPLSRPLLSPQCVPGPRLLQRAGEDGRRFRPSGAHRPWGTRRKTVKGRRVLTWQPPIAQRAYATEKVHLRESWPLRKVQL